MDFAGYWEVMPSRGLEVNSKHHNFVNSERFKSANNIGKVLAVYAPALPQHTVLGSVVLVTYFETWRTPPKYLRAGLPRSNARQGCLKHEAPPPGMWAGMEGLFLHFLGASSFLLG